MRAGDVDILSYLWDKLPKSEDGQHIIYTDVDIELLWHTGFIDTALFPLDEWKQAMEPQRNSAGEYHLTRSDFLAIDRYRYKGEIFAPFDARDINEGLYTDEGFQDLLESSIIPECGLAPEAMHEWQEQFRSQARSDDGLLRMDVQAKAQIGKLLQDHPSPLRRLETLFLESAKSKNVDVAIDDVPMATMGQAYSDAQASAFALLSNNEDADKQHALKSLENAKLPETSGDAPEGPTTSLKDIVRSRRGRKI